MQSISYGRPAHLPQINRRSDDDRHADQDHGRQSKARTHEALSIAEYPMHTNISRSAKSRRKGFAMRCRYLDIRDRLGEPRWFDEAGVPRYCEFHPDECETSTPTRPSYCDRPAALRSAVSRRSHAPARAAVLLRNGAWTENWKDHPPMRVSRRSRLVDAGAANRVKSSIWLKVIKDLLQCGPPGSAINQIELAAPGFGFRRGPMEIWASDSLDQSTPLIGPGGLGLAEVREAWPWPCEGGQLAVTMPPSAPE